MCRSIVGECPFFRNKVENHFLVNVVADIAANQLSIPHHGTNVWPELKKKIPLVSYAVHLSFEGITQSLSGQGHRSRF